MRVAAVARMVLGAVELTRPTLLTAHRRPDTVTRRAVRVVGIRDLTQAGITLASPTDFVVRLGLAVDLLHGASMLALAAADHRRRPTALRGAVLAGVFAAAGAISLRRGHDVHPETWCAVVPAHLRSTRARCFGARH